MKYICYDMNAYKLHIIKTKKFKTVTVDISFRRTVNKDEITIRNLLKDMIINASYNYPTEKKLVIQTEKLYDLKLLSSSMRFGNYSIMSIRSRFLNEKYTEFGMFDESLKFILDVLFNPIFDNDLEKCKNKLKKSIISINDNKIKYSIFKLLENAKDMPYSYNSYGNVEDLEKIDSNMLKKYYSDVINNDSIDIFVVGDVDEFKVKEIIRDNFKINRMRDDKKNVVVEELNHNNKVINVKESDNVNQSQLAILCSINGLTDYERKYVLPVYGEMLGGSSNSLLFDVVREKNSYAYYVNALVKPYDNTVIIYSGVENGNEKTVIKLIQNTLKKIERGKFDKNKFESAKKVLISLVESTQDNPIAIINHYYNMNLVNSLDIDEKIDMIKNVSSKDIISVSKKIRVYSTFILEETDEKD